MKHIRKLVLILGMFTAFSLSAQEDRQTKTMDSGSAEDMVSESTVKTYKLVLDDKVVRNSVKINTVKHQDIKLEDEGSSMVNPDRQYPKKEIIKTVMIDNDADDDYDEQIRFRYRAHASSDFVMVTNGDEILIGLEEGENLRILDAQRILKNDAKDGLESFIFTDQNGAEVEFIIDEYKALGKTEGM